MTYLTRIQVDRRQAVSLKISDAYRWHEEFWKAFPDRPDSNRDFLFRIDASPTGFIVHLLSATKPSLPLWGEWETKCVVETFLNHDAYRFQLKANPTMRRNEDHRRLGLYDVEHLLKWLVDNKAKQHGFRVETDHQSVEIIGPTDEFFVKKNRRGKHVSVDFRGVLTVTNRETFKEAFRKGIGSAKAFGYGLLILQPI